MRHFVDRFRRAIILVAVPLLLAGCDKLTPAGGNTTMTLLRDGSEKICISADVQKALRELIVPKAAELSSDVTLEFRAAAVARISLSYELTTLQSFDNAVSRATCNTTVTLRATGNDKTGKFRMNFEVSPSAENPNAFVVSAAADDAHAFASELASNAVDQAQNEAEQADIDRQEAEQKRQLLAVVNEKWLLGAWISSVGSSADCGNGQAIWFEPAHVLEGALGKGRWALADDKLHTVGGDANHFDTTLTITQADPISFQATTPDDKSVSLRRCTRSETETLPQAPAEGSVTQ